MAPNETRGANRRLWVLVSTYQGNPFWNSSFLGWMDGILHHLRNGGMMNANRQWFPMVSKWCLRGFCPFAVWNVFGLDLNSLERWGPTIGCRGPWRWCGTCARTHKARARKGLPKKQLPDPFSLCVGFFEGICSCLFFWFGGGRYPFGCLFFCGTPPPPGMVLVSLSSHQGSLENNKTHLPGAVLWDGCEIRWTIAGYLL